MAGRTRKRGGHSGEHENSERWLLTYADMITLLVAFFIMLYAMSVVNQQKFQQLAISVRSGFGGSITNGAPTIFSQGGGTNGARSIVSNSKNNAPISDLQRAVFSGLPDPERALQAHQDSQRLDQAYAAVRTYIRTHGLENAMGVTRNERGVVVTVLTDQMLFASGEGDLRPEELGMLNTVAQVINTVPNAVRIEGHTDNLPIHTPRFPSNWELSVTRATSVLRYFMTRRVSAARLEAAGYADQRPAAPNDSDAHRRQNRRVDVVILRQY